MKTLRFILSAAIICFFNTVNAQSSTVALLDNDGKMAVFSVNATSDKSSDLVDVATRQLFVALLDEGVEGLENGQKLMKKENAKWKTDFMGGKKPKYMTYVKGVQTEGMPMRNSVGEYEATVLIKINLEFFMRQLKGFGVR